MGCDVGWSGVVGILVMLKQGVGEVWMWSVLAFWTGVVAWSLFREVPPPTGWQIEGVKLVPGAFGFRLDDVPSR